MRIATRIVLGSAVGVLVLGGLSLGRPRQGEALAASQDGAATVTAAVDGDRQVYFGDLHLHTSYSLDAAAAQTETTPDDAYRYAKGEVVTYLGRPVQRNAPLDFLAVTDHAEYLGNVRAAMAGEITLPGDQSRWQRLFANRGGPTMFELFGGYPVPMSLAAALNVCAATIIALGKRAA